MKKIGFLFSLSITILLGLILNGNLMIPGSPLPPLAKFLHPVDGIWSNGVNRSRVSVDQQLHLNGVEDAWIKYDDRLVPHIYANSREDLLFLQGYVEAKHRLFQLDIIARAAAGRLSEIFGIRTLDADIKQNRKYMEKSAEQAVESWKAHPGAYELYGHYIDGINAYINQLTYKDYPIEFKLLNYQPEAWSYYKSALVSKYMANTLSRREHDIESMNMKLLLGDDLFEELFEEGEDGGFPVIPNEKQYDFDSIYGDPQKEIVTADKILKKSFFDRQPKGIGSNNWVVGKSKTKNGNTIFANDPHLSLSLPSIWYEMHLMTPDLNSYGVTIPGIAGLLMGFNENIVWGETNVGHDVADMYLITYANDEHTKYIIDGEEHDIEFDIQEIKIKGQPSYFDTLRYTKWGLIVHESLDHKNDVAMHWLPAQKAEEPDIITFIDFMSCANYTEFEKVSRSFSSPAQNFLFGAKDGDIALRINGVLPAKHQQDGRFIKDGTVSKNAWTDYIPRSQNPQILNPKSDYLTSSNQRSASDNYPYYYNGTFEHFRNRIINRHLQNDSLITIEKMKTMQGDSYSVLAEDLLPLLLEKTQSNHPILKTLSDWNYSYDADAQAPVYFNLWLNQLRKDIFDELYAYQDSMSISIPEDWKIVDLIKNHCDHRIFDKLHTNELESCSDIIDRSLKNVIEEISEMDEDISWSEFKPVSIKHYARIPAFSRSDIKSSGWTDAINAMGSSFGPSWRMVVELGDTVKAFGVYPGGQSGNPASPFYDNAIDPWSKNEHFSLQFFNQSDFTNFKGLINIKIN